MGEPTLSDADSDGLDQDFGGSGTITHEQAEDSHLPTDAGVDFVLDDPSRGDDDEGRTREITGIPNSNRPWTLGSTRSTWQRSKATQTARASQR